MLQRGGIPANATRPTLDAILSVEELPRLEQPASEQDVIPEETEGDWEDHASPTAPDTESDIVSPLSEDMKNPLHDPSFYRPAPLRRATSHESLLSVSGLDVHTLKSRPSQLLAPYRGRGITSQAVLADTNAHAAKPAAMSRPSENSKSLLSGMAADQRQQAASANKPGVGKKVGGWIFGRWGATPEPTSQAEASPAAAAKQIDKALTASTAAKEPAPATAPQPINKALSISSADEGLVGTSPATPRKIKVRSPGVNQTGPLLGFFPEVKTPIREPIMKNLDEQALKSLLENGT
jgi:hypothetical protein